MPDRRPSGAGIGGPMSSFHLELNALIGCRDHLRQLAASSDFIYTSYWAITEELVNLNEDNYWMVRKLFRALDDSGLFIDWTDNYAIVLNAFRVTFRRKPRADVVREAFFDIIRTRSYSELSVDRVKQIKNHARIRRQFDRNRRTMNVYDDIKERTKYRRELNSQGLFMLEDTILRLLPYFELSGDEMLSRYDHTLDRFLLAEGKFIFEKRLVERNDGFDLEYFKYLQNDATYMVSNDRLMHHLDFKKVYTNEELLQREHLW